MTREDPTWDHGGPDETGPEAVRPSRRRLGPGGTGDAGGRVVVTVLDRAADTADGVLDGRVLDTAEVRVLSASGLAAVPATGEPPDPRTAVPRSLPDPANAADPSLSSIPPERGMPMSTDTTAKTALQHTSSYRDLRPADAPDDAPRTVTRVRFPRADQELRERTAFTAPGWLAGAGLLAAAAAGAWALAASGPVDGRLPDGVTDSPLLDVSAPVASAVGVGAGLLGLMLLLGMFVVQTGTVRVLSSFGRYKGTVRRTGLVWAAPLRRRRKVDVRLRHWRSRPMDLTDRQGTPLQVMVLVVWQVRDSARAKFAVRDHEQYLRQQIEASVSTVVAGLPCDSFTRGAASLRDSEHVGEEMTRRLSGATTAAGVQVFSVQVLHIDYAPQVAESMLRRRIASLDAATRTAVLDDVVDTVSQAVDQFTRRALVRLDEDGRTEFIRDLTVAMYTARGTAGPARD